MADLKGPTDVYRVFDEYWSLLYVGVSHNAFHRFKQHERRAPWWGMAEWFKVTRFYNREDALRTEAVHIGLEEPPFNIDQCAGKFELGWADIHNGIIKYPSYEEHEFHVSRLGVFRNG